MEDLGKNIVHCNLGLLLSWILWEYYPVELIGQIEQFAFWVEAGFVQ